MCPISKAALDAILKNPSLTPDEQTLLNSIEVTIDSLLPVYYDGTICDIDRWEVFEKPLIGIQGDRKLIIWNQLVTDYALAGWLVVPVAAVTHSIIRFSTPGYVPPIEIEE